MSEANNLETRKNDGGLNRILVASDLTAYSDRAVMLTKANHATLRFLRAIDPKALPESYVQ